MKRRASQASVNRPNFSSTSQSIPAPVGGWNTRDSVSLMDPTDAILMDNWFPNASNVILRKGATDWATGLGVSVKSFIPYASSTARELFAATNNGIYDVTVEGAVGAAEIALTDGYGQTCNFKTAAGSYAYFVNGVDTAKLYDGTTWMSVTGVSSPALTGIATTELVHVCVFKRRLWFTQKNSMSVWYLPVDSIGGALTEFLLGQYFARGGYITAMGTWSIDGGDGIDDYAVFVSSEGEIAVFRGVDPSSATDFQIVGVYYIGSPLGRRCLQKFGGDVLYLSRFGLFPLSKALQSSSLERSTALSDKISPTFAESAELYGSNVGWETTVFPKANLLFVNVPYSPGVRSDQYTMNTLTGSWCRFLGWIAHCSVVWNDRLYFGGEGKVFEGWTGTDDFSANIVSQCKTAYSYYGARGQLKHFKMIRPVLKISNTFTFDLGLSVDFEELSYFSVSEVGTASQSVWDTAVWDTALWATESEPWKVWYTAAVPDGFAISIELKVTSMTATIEWNSTDVLYEVGGVI